MRIAAAADVERRLCELAAHVHASTAELARLAAEFEELEGWCGEGVRSFSHWLTINAGFSPHSGDELLRVGQALQTLPSIRAAFGAGQLSFDGVRELSRVATAEDEDVWLDVAAAASGAQLARICRACRRVLDLDTPQHADEHVGVLTSEDLEGRRHLDGGPALSASTIRRLGCDASVIAITERDGIPINVGRSRRILPRALAGRCRGAAGPAASPAAQFPLRRPMPTTSSTGLTAGRRIWATWSLSAISTIAAFTTARTRSAAIPTLG